MKLFMIGIGGNTKKSNIEVHDIQFVTAEKFEDTYKVLDERWYGDNLHIDSYKELTEIDGYKIDVGGESDEELFLVFYGGINPNMFGEAHAMTFVIAETEEAARIQAKELMGNYEHMNHIDEVSNVSKLLSVPIGFTPGDYSYNELADWQGYIEVKKHQ